MSGIADFKVTDLVGAPARHGYVYVDRAIIDTAEVERCTREFGPGKIEEGPLTRLWVRETMVMSDGLAEYTEHREAIERAHGRVLVHGLGLGCYVKAILAKPEVAAVDVIEINEDVLALIGPYYAKDSRVNLIRMDALDHARVVRGSSVRWDCIWSDIWPTRDVDHLAEHARMFDCYSGLTDWHGCWIHEDLLDRKRQGYVSVTAFVREMSAKYRVEIDRVHLGYIPEWAG
jgi:hypothetical protein